MDKARDTRNTVHDDAGIDLLHLWAVVYRRKWLILGSALLITILSVVWVNNATPIYQSTSVVHIQSNQPNIVAVPDIYGIDTRQDDYYNTQAEILKGRSIAGKVVDTFATADEASAKPVPASGFLSFDWRSLLPFKAPEPPGGPVEKDPREQRISAYLSGLTIEPITGTQLVRIHYESADPRIAASYANAHADAYIESILDARFALTETASSWMSRRVEELRSKLQESEAKLQAYREQEQLIDSQGIQALPTMQINELTGRLVDARGRLSSARIAYLQVYGDGPEPIESVPAILDNPAVRQFRQVQAQAEQKVAELSQRYGPKHPNMIAAQSELAEATDNLIAQQRNVSGGIRAEYFAAQSEVRALEEELNTAKQSYQEVSRKGAGLAELQREVETNRQLYDLFYNRLRETAQTSDLESVNARVVQLAVVPTAPIKPRKQTAVMMALAFGLALGIGTAFLLELARNTIRSSFDVEELINLPLLGSIPALGKRASARAATALFSDQERKFGEAIRTIRTGLTLSDPDKSNKVILVTSSVVGEGKSTVAMNLALAFARFERVLLIDADMRRPSIARELAIDAPAPGLPELLAGDAYLNKSISFLEKYNLEVMRTETVPTDPLELLSLGSLSKTMKALRETYDRIIIDSPPVLAVSDPGVLATHADSIAYIVKFDSTTRRQIETGLQKLEVLQHHAPIAGIVLNQVNFKKAESYGDYDHGDYYEYPETDEVERRRSRISAAASL